MFLPIQPQPTSQNTHPFSSPHFSREERGAHALNLWALSRTSTRYTYTSASRESATTGRPSRRRSPLYPINHIRSIVGCLFLSQKRTKKHYTHFPSLAFLDTPYLALLCLVAFPSLAEGRGDNFCLHHQQSAELLKIMNKTQKYTRSTKCSTRIQRAASDEL